MWWQWLIFALLIPIIPFSLAYFVVWSKKKYSPNKEQEKIASINIAKYTLFYWLGDLFYMSFIIDSIVWKYIFGGLIMLIIFYNLSSAVINQKSRMDNGFIKFGIIQDFVVGVGISVYLIYIIPDITLQSIVIAIVAALYGGLFTLVGVAWTIRKGEKDRIEERHRLDEERREDERKKHKPLVNYFDGAYKNAYTTILAAEWLMKNDEISSIQTEVLKEANYIRSCFFVNTDFAHFFVWGLKFNDDIFPFSSYRLIRKDLGFFLDFGSGPLYTKEKISSMSLILEDVLENYYELRLEITFLAGPIKAIKINGNDLPKYIKDFDKGVNNE